MDNIFDNKYEIRMAEYSEIDEIMEFIGKYWRKGHILSLNRPFFEYEFVIKNNKVNVITARNKDTSEIEAMIGFLQASYDIKDVWGACWKVRNDHPNLPFLGIEILKRMIKINNIQNYIVIGGNSKTAIPMMTKIYKYKSKKMNHYYRLSDKNDFKIAVVNKKYTVKKNVQIKQIKPVEVFSIDELKQYYNFSSVSENIPYKDEWYFNHRFFEHPIYKYRVFALNNAFLVAREQEALGEKILRIVNYEGDKNCFSGLYDFFEKQLNNYEYIDFYNIGFDDIILKNAGFIKKEENSENVIPNYFSPFVQENIDIYTAFEHENTEFYKADGDQDRPN